MDSANADYQEVPSLRLPEPEAGPRVADDVIEVESSIEAPSVSPDVERRFLLVDALNNKLLEGVNDGSITPEEAARLFREASISPDELAAMTESRGMLPAPDEGGESVRIAEEPGEPLTRAELMELEPGELKEYLWGDYAPEPGKYADELSNLERIIKNHEIVLSSEEATGPYRDFLVRNKSHLELQTDWLKREIARSGVLEPGRMLPAETRKDIKEGSIAELKPVAEEPGEIETVPAWEIGPDEYQRRAGVYQPHIAEISPYQYARMSKRQQKAYDEKRSKEWDASRRIKEEWRDQVAGAYERGEIDLKTPGLHREAEDVILHVEIEKEKAAKEAALSKAVEENEIKSLDEISLGDRVFAVGFGRHITIKKINKKSVWGVDDQGEKIFVKTGRRFTGLQWKHYNAVKEAAETGESVKPVRRSKETVPEAEPVVTEAAKEETGAWSWIKDVNRENAGERLAEAEARIQELDEEMNSAFEIDDIEAIQKEQLILNAWTDAIRTAIRTGIDYNFPKLDDYKQKAESPMLSLKGFRNLNRPNLRWISIRFDQGIGGSGSGRGIWGRRSRILRKRLSIPGIRRSGGRWNRRGFGRCLNARRRNINAFVSKSRKRSRGSLSGH